MRIAINTRFLIPGKMEGIGLFTQEVAKRLVERRPQDKFLFLFDRPFDSEFIFADNVEAKVVFPPARHPFLWYWWFEWAIPRVLRQWKADVFFSPDGYVSLRSKVPTVLVTHDLAFEHYPEQVPYLASTYYRHFVPKFHSRAEQVVSVSEYTSQDIIRTYGIDSTKVATACNGVRTPFKPLSGNEIAAVQAQYADGRPYFFYVGAVHPRKNVDRLIRAFSEFKKASGSDTKLLIAGRFAWQSESVRTAYEQSAYQNDIKLLGYLSGEALGQVLGAARALTYVSLFEGFGVPLLEAMYAEVPIISSNVSSMPEVCGTAGLLVDPTSIEAISQAMQQLDSTPSLRQKLVDQGRIQRTKFSWDKATDIIEESIFRALQGKLLNKK
ncbi:MAG: glycosyltransferase family 4 protein [Saprospiraceae bacterium]|nr:glycosyltransferase family 4 protein [Saprospiraceae bacterium]